MTTNGRYRALENIIVGRPLQLLSSRLEKNRACCGKSMKLGTHVHVTKTSTFSYSAKPGYAWGGCGGHFPKWPLSEKLRGAEPSTLTVHIGRILFLIDNVMTTDPTTIANKFNTFFAGIGVELSANVNNTHNAHLTDYLLNPSVYTFTFELITEETTMDILNVDMMEFPQNYLKRVRSKFANH